MTLKRAPLLFVVVTGFVSSAFYEPTCSGTGSSCIDCLTQKYCFMGTLWSTTKCPPNTYCNPSNGLCSPTPVPECKKASLITCPRPEGVFPDLNSCTQYLHCSNSTPTTIPCSPGYVYNPKLGKCTYQLKNTDCAKINCGIASGPAQEYPGDSSLYFQCLGGIPQLAACPDTKYFNTTTQACENICKSVGFVPNWQNCSEYISCELFPNSAAISTIKKVCPSGTGFSETTGICQIGLQNLCYENSVVIKGIRRFIPAIFRDVINGVLSVLANLGWSFVSIPLMFGVNENVISDAVLVVDGVLNGGKFPYTLLRKVFDVVIFFIPPPLRTLVLPPLEMVFSVVVSFLGSQ